MLIINKMKSFVFMAVVITGMLLFFQDNESLMDLYLPEHFTEKNVSAALKEAPCPVATAGQPLVVNGRFICPSATKLFDPQELRKAIDEVHSFHTKGGSLKAVQEYLDENMQSTLDNLGLKFTFKGHKEPTTNAVKDLFQYFSQNKVKRGGYGQPLPGNFHGNNVKVLDDKRWIQVLEPLTDQRQTTAIGPVGPGCRHLVHFGKGYETKFMCITNTEKNGTAREEEDCHLFSIGSNDQWGFEKAARSKLPQCQTHTFDCTLKNGKPKRKPKDKQVYFYDSCIGEKAGNPKHKGYGSLYNESGIQSPPRYLKMDVEGFEYQVLLDSVLASPQELWPEQIMVETHWSSRMVDLPSVLRLRQAGELALFYSSMFHHGGYIPVYAKNYKICTPCMEVLLVKVLCETPVQTLPSRCK